MSVGEVDTDILWKIAAKEALLRDAEDFLILVGEFRLQKKLNKLQQDAGVALASNCIPVEDKEHPSHHENNDLVHDYEPVTPACLSIFDEVGVALEKHGSKCSLAYDAFLTGLKSLLPVAPAPTAAPAGPAPTL